MPTSQLAPHPLLKLPRFNVEDAVVAPLSSSLFLSRDEDALEAIASVSRHTWQQKAKRTFDLLAALLGLMMIAPLLLIIALLVACTSPGPVLYKSRRIGKNYRPFDMLKFRTMSLNADAQREALRRQANLQGGLFKLENDPRVTAVGKALRALSLDELPQLFNVLRGDMSLVGPRPLPPDESNLFEKPYTLRFNVYPGITGVWQVSGRSRLSFQHLCELEMGYVQRWNLFSDLKILLQTFPAVLMSRGAY